MLRNEMTSVNGRLGSDCHIRPHKISNIKAEFIGHLALSNYLYKRCQCVEFIITIFYAFQWLNLIAMHAN